MIDPKVLFKNKQTNIKNMAVWMKPMHTHDGIVLTPAQDPESYAQSVQSLASKLRTPGKCDTTPH